MRSIEEKIDQLHNKVKHIQEKSNQMRITTDRKIKDLDEKIFSQELRISKIENNTKCSDKQKTWKITCIERLFWIAFIVGFLSIFIIRG